MILPFRREGEMELSDYTSATNINKKDFMPGTSKIDRALTGQIAGLQMKRNSGMPLEKVVILTYGNTYTDWCKCTVSGYQWGSLYA